MDWVNDFIGLLILVAVWETGWKCLALWKAARNGQKKWYLALFLLNTIGLLPIIYLQFFQKTAHKK